MNDKTHHVEEIFSDTIKDMDKIHQVGLDIATNLNGLCDSFKREIQSTVMVTCQSSVLIHDSSKALHREIVQTTDKAMEWMSLMDEFHHDHLSSTLPSILAQFTQLRHDLQTLDAML